MLRSRIQLFLPLLLTALFGITHPWDFLLCHPLRAGVQEMGFPLQALSLFPSQCFLLIHNWGPLPLRHSSLLPSHFLRSWCHLLSHLHLSLRSKRLHSQSPYSRSPTNLMYSLYLLSQSVTANLGARRWPQRKSRWVVRSRGLKAQSDQRSGSSSQVGWHFFTTYRDGVASSNFLPPVEATVQSAVRMDYIFFLHSLYLRTSAVDWSQGHLTSGRDNVNIILSTKLNCFRCMLRYLPNAGVITSGESWTVWICVNCFEGFMVFVLFCFFLFHSTQFSS